MDYYEPCLANFTNATIIQLEYNIPHPYYFENFTSRQLWQNHLSATVSNIQT